jgi:hypothetical protein
MYIYFYPFSLVLFSRLLFFSVSPDLILYVFYLYFCMFLLFSLPHELHIGMFVKRNNIIKESCFIQCSLLVELLNCTSRETIKLKVVKTRQ